MLYHNLSYHSQFGHASYLSRLIGKIIACYSVSDWTTNQSWFVPFGAPQVNWRIEREVYNFKLLLLLCIDICEASQGVKAGIFLFALTRKTINSVKNIFSEKAKFLAYLNSDNITKFHLESILIFQLYLAILEDLISKSYKQRGTKREWVQDTFVTPFTARIP